MKVAPSKPHCGPVAPSIRAFRRFTPRAMAIWAVVRHYDGVVHQHTHGDDKSCQRRSVESDAEEKTMIEQCTLR